MRKRSFQGTDFIKYDSEGVHICRKTVFLTGSDLIGHVSRGSSKTQPVLAFLNKDQVARDSEVEDLDNAVRIESKVLRFEVTEKYFKQRSEKGRQDFGVSSLIAILTS